MIDKLQYFSLRMILFNPVPSFHPLSLRSFRVFLGLISAFMVGDCVFPRPRCLMCTLPLKRLSTPRFSLMARITPRSIPTNPLINTIASVPISHLSIYPPKPLKGSVLIHRPVLASVLGSSHQTSFLLRRCWPHNHKLY